MRWTTEKENYLKEIYENNSKEFILSKINKPWITIRRKALKLDLHRDSELIDQDRKIKGPRADSWTTEEEELLREIYENNPKEFILPKFNRSWQSIRINAIRLGLQRSSEIVKQEMIDGGKNAVRDDFWTTEEINLLKKIYENNSKDFIIPQFKNRTWKTIREKAVKLGLRRNQNIINSEIMETHKKTMMKRYGVEYSTQLDSMKEKTRQTNIERWGVEYPFQSKEVRKKVKKLVQKKYGVDNVFQSEEIKQKITETNLEKYGVKNPLQNKDIKEKTKDTNIKKYGIKNTFQLTDRIKESMLDKYGEDNPLKVPEIKERVKRTNLKRYGVTVPSKNPKIKEKMDSTNLKRYGVKSPFQNLFVKEKIKGTCLDKYGVENPAQSKEIQDKIKSTCLDKYGVEYSLQAEEVRNKGYETAKKNKSFVKSNEEENFFKYLKFFDSNTKKHLRHPLLKHIIDFYMPEYDLWVQFDGAYWHGKIKRENITRRSQKIEEIVKRDQFQNENIPNLIRFWSDDVKKAITNNSIMEIIISKIEEKLPGTKKAICHQFNKKLEWYEKDLKNLPFDPNLIKASEFNLSYDLITPEIIEFIEKYEWLGKIGVNPKWCFTARYKNILGGVVLINEPTAYSTILGKNTPIYEALIQRGATASWAPKNLGSRLIMFSCKWMVKNTSKRAFVAYGDPAANEIGTIYQACGFDYLGNTFGNTYLYRHPKINKDFSTQSLKRTSVFKRWCKKYEIIIEKNWLNEKGFKILNNIPEEIKKKWNEWIKKIIDDSIKIKINKKHKYVLILSKDKKEKKFLNSIKNYKSYIYRKR